MLAILIDVTKAIPVVLSKVKSELPLLFNPSLNCTAVVGPAGATVAVIPDNPEPSPINDPENDPVIPYDPVGN